MIGLLSVTLLFSTPSAPQAHDANAWAPWQFLVGEWTAQGSGEAGRGTGAFSFSSDLKGKILVRKNRAEYPATQDHPAYTHEDLMVIYAEGKAALARAIYFDNEGHVIHYSAQFGPGQRTATFLSDPQPSAPRFRLTYTGGKNETLLGKFEIAPPGKPDSFSTYLEWIARRKKKTH